MTVTFHIPGPLHQFVGGNSQVDIQVHGQTVRDALMALWMIHPGIRDRLATEQGQIREHINIFVGNENIRQTGGLATPIFADAEISIVPAISGGAY